VDWHLKALIALAALYTILFLLWRLTKFISAIGTPRRGVVPGHPDFPQHEVLWHEKDPISFGAPLEWNREED
jgi:hypothetical protein